MTNEEKLTLKNDLKKAIKPLRRTLYMNVKQMANNTATICLSELFDAKCINVNGKSKWEITNYDTIYIEELERHYYKLLADVLGDLPVGFSIYTSLLYGLPYLYCRLSY